MGSLFSGIGGIDLGLERAGMEIAWQVEIDDYCRRVLAKHWPDVPKYGDIRECGAHNLTAVDVLAGGFPCQPVSHAGKRKAQDDARWLWPEFARLVRELRPRYVFVENVPGLLDGPISDVLGDLAASGYDAEWDCIPAAAVGAPHLRDRVWLLAYPGHDGRGAEHGVEQAARPKVFGSGGAGDVADATGNGRQWCGATWSGRHGLADGGEALADTRGRGCAGQGQPFDSCDPAAVGEGQAVEPLDGRLGEIWRVEPGVGRVAHGVPRRMDRLRGLGNAVVPQIVEWIGRRIMEAEGGIIGGTR